MPLFSSPIPSVDHNYLESWHRDTSRGRDYVALFTLDGRYLGLVGYGPTRASALENVLGGLHRRIVENGGYYKGATELPCQTN